ncbi:MAG: ATP-binding protein [Armatimonadetes bacterium]|nr:ATP-binding protein [Armatimonadota bacterium]
MAIKKRIKNLSKLTRELLAEGESVRSDFKRLPESVSTDDLVSFANSETGGQILAGVDEKTVDNAQVGVVRGCDVSDGTVLQILNKAVSCIPPVLIDVYIENLGNKPILRVEVPPSQTKPHCTPKGIYCRRDGARNRPLHPSELLRLFLDSEASAFAARFEVAAGRITNELSKLESSLDGSIRSMSDQLGWADSQLGDTESALSNVQGLVAKLIVDTDNTNSRLRALFRQDAREDPVREKARLQHVNWLINEIKEDDVLFAHVVSGGQLSVNGKQPGDGDFTDEDAEQMLEIAVRHIHDAERDKKYRIVVKAPKACSDDELDQFVSKVVEGGEVDDGIRKRIKRALRLGFIVHDDKLVGTAALEKPAAGYRAKVFKKAKSHLNPTAYPYELGWIFLDVPHRKKGQMTRLIDDLLPAAKDYALFATARTSNEIMREMLTQLRFFENGTEYESEQNPKDAVALFVRATPET